LAEDVSHYFGNCIAKMITFVFEESDEAGEVGIENLRNLLADFAQKLSSVFD